MMTTIPNIKLTNKEVGLALEQIVHKRMVNHIIRTSTAQQRI